jgi:hypothetical protein
MSNILHDDTTSSDRKLSPWDSIGARAAADLNTPGVVEEIFDAGREHQRRLSADIAAGVVIEESDVEDIYAAGREYERAVTAKEAALLDRLLIDNA